MIIFNSFKWFLEYEDWISIDHHLWTMEESLTADHLYTKGEHSIRISCGLYEDSHKVISARLYKKEDLLHQFNCETYKEFVSEYNNLDVLHGIDCYVLFNIFYNKEY